MSAHHFQLKDLPATPWKNGGGSTCELACWPPQAGLDDFGWRVSIATIDAAGPFSLFEGVDRTIMLLQGDGVQLRSGDGRIDHRLDSRHRPFAFSGDAAVDCTLLGGSSKDLNVMTRRGRWVAEVQVLDRAAPIAAAPQGLLLALLGNWRLGDALPLCREGEVLCWTEAPSAWKAEPEAPGARLAVIRFIAATS
jgi:environmental stress-induced protein Ves